MCATIYYCITGKTPIEAIDRAFEDQLKKPSELGIEISPAAENALMYGLAVIASDRCPDMTELMRLLSGETAPQKKKSEEQPTPATVRPAAPKPEPKPLPPQISKAAGRRAISVAATLLTFLSSLLIINVGVIFWTKAVIIIEIVSLILSISLCIIPRTIMNKKPDAVIILNICVVLLAMLSAAFYVGNVYYKCDVTGKIYISDITIALTLSLSPLRTQSSAGFPFAGIVFSYYMFPLLFLVNDILWSRKAIVFSYARITLIGPAILMLLIETVVFIIAAKSPKSRMAFIVFAFCILTGYAGFCIFRFSSSYIACFAIARFFGCGAYGVFSGVILSRFSQIRKQLA